MGSILSVMIVGGDDTHAIQSALDHLSQRDGSTANSGAMTSGKTDSGTWRGAAVLAPGVFHISTTLYLRGDRVVLRGSLSGADVSTELRVVGKSRRPAIVIGSDSYDRWQETKTTHANDQTFSTSIVGYVPVGANRVHVESTYGLAVGQSISIVHPSSQPWIEAVGMRSFPDDDGKGSWLNWKANTIDQKNPEDGSKIELCGDLLPKKYGQGPKNRLKVELPSTKADYEIKGRILARKSSLTRGNQ